MVATTTALLMAAGIAAAGSAGSAAIGSHAAGKAADTQVAAGEQAQQDAQKAVDEANPQIQQAADTGIGWVGDAADYGSQQVSDAQQKGAAGVQAATDKANALLDPYAAAGTDATKRLSDLAGEKFQFSQDDPSYKWRLQQGQQALERSAAARGSLLGGGTAKAMARYSQGLASTEYQNAFNRWDTTRRTSAGILDPLAGRGLTAAGQSGQNTIFAGKYGSDTGIDAAKFGAGLGYDAATFGANLKYNSASQQAQNKISGARTLADILAGNANAKAAGTVGSANAWGGALNSSTSNLGQLILLSSLLEGNGGGSGAPTVNPNDFSLWGMTKPTVP